ncbi:unnamed protein product [Orchesella dallaii]|uniref:Uncharacterized protein n=1 Tax=Orchesella dallaii TaxID=48710 RepID=A0ABP1PUH5_9HEXA
MRSLFIIVALLYTLFTFTLIPTDAQVNFSPAWGKRSTTDWLGESQDQSPSEYQNVVAVDGCQTPLECLLRMQRYSSERAARLSNAKIMKTLARGDEKFD